MPGTTVYEALTRQLRALGLHSFPCAPGSWNKSSLLNRKSPCSDWESSDPEEESQDNLKDLLIQHGSPWELDDGCSPEAERIRELAVTCPDVITEQFIHSYFRCIRVVDQEVTEVDDELLKFHNLEELVLSANKLTTVSSCNLPRTLKVLELCSNHISSLQDLTLNSPPVLQHLGLAHNKIQLSSESTYLTADFWPTLVSLDLSFNDLTDLFDLISRLCTLHKLRILVLQGNPLTFIPAYRGYTIDSLKKLCVLDDISILPDEKHKYAGLFEQKESLTNKATLFVHIGKVHGIPNPSNVTEPQNAGEYPVTTINYRVRYEFIEDQDRGELPICQDQRRNINTFVKKVYLAYFKVRLGDQDKNWGPHKVCKTCVETLRSWSKGKNAKLKFGVPMVWREPTNHLDNCYFCLVNVKGFNKKNKQHLQSPDIPSARRPVEHFEEIPGPVFTELPQIDVESLSLPASTDDDDDAQIEYTPSDADSLFSQTELNDLHERYKNRQLTTPEENVPPLNALTSHFHTDDDDDAQIEYTPSDADCDNISLFSQPELNDLHERYKNRQLTTPEENVPPLNALTSHFHTGLYESGGLPWSETIEYNYEKEHTITDLLPLKLFLLSDMTVTVTEEKILSWPQDANQGAAISKHDKKGGGKDKGKDKARSSSGGSKAGSKSKKKKENLDDLRHDPPVVRTLGSVAIPLESLVSGEGQTFHVCNFGTLATDMGQDGNDKAHHDGKKNKEQKIKSGRKSVEAHKTSRSSAKEKNKDCNIKPTEDEPQSAPIPLTAEITVGFLH
ncbi:PREDICTED: leucine-rich repeat-containing protein 43 [Nanorana parkeri]|uniref:leucine-rich repeat-containing protein 43 n=1 Tax=Nanorana parkeri TaxID=125878 RepID=UPI00085488DF|nr:PREDICTED: leucine-rich repeat-containing protein 43 [Nanorana parkeri]